MKINLNKLADSILTINSSRDKSNLEYIIPQNIRLDNFLSELAIKLEVIHLKVIHNGRSTKHITTDKKNALLI